MTESCPYMSTCAHTVDLDSIQSKVAAAHMIQVTVPSEFVCPLTHDVMDHPMITRSGIHYERSAILALLQYSGCGICPMTNTPLTLNDLISDCALKNKIDFWLWEHDIRSIPQLAADMVEEKPLVFFSNYETIIFSNFEKEVEKHAPTKPQQKEKESTKVDVIRRLFASNNKSARAA